MLLLGPLVVFSPEFTSGKLLSCYTSLPTPVSLLFNMFVQFTLQQASLLITGQEAIFCNFVFEVSYFLQNILKILYIWTESKFPNIKYHVTMFLFFFLLQGFQYVCKYFIYVSFLFLNFFFYQFQDLKKEWTFRKIRGSHGK